MNQVPNIIADRYQVKEVIGSGGMGQVLRAYDPNLAIDVAIKILHSADVGSTAVRLQREAIAAGKLNHRNIARVYDFGQTAEGEPYMVMEYLSGIALSDFIKKETRVATNQAVNIFIQICSGLQLAHQSGTVHRDLKPSNIMLVENGDTGAREVKILDFGVAKLERTEQKLTNTNAVVGSPLYMSPEQASGQDVDSRSDIYSLGCLMFETLTGMAPLKGKSALETISMHRGKAPPRISEIIEHADFPERMVELVNKCLAKLPDQRPQTVAEIKDELLSIEEEIADTAISIKEDASLGKFIPKTKFKHLVIVLTSVFAVSGVVYSVVKWQFDIQNQRRLQFDKEHRSKVDIAPIPGDMNDVEIATKRMVETRPTKLGKTAGGEKAISLMKFTTDEELSQLEGQQDLRAVQLHNCMLIKGWGLRFLNKIPLTIIDLRNTKIEEENLKYLLPISTLEMLYLTSPNLSDKGVEELIKLKNLKVVNLGSDKLTDRAAQLLSTLPLKELELKSIKITDKSVDSLLKSKLLLLTLENTSVSKDVGIKIAKIHTVKQVYLTGSKEISKDSLKALSDAGVLQLGLGNVPLTKKHFEIIAQNKILSRLDLPENANKPEDIAGLKNLNHPIHLVLKGTKLVTDELIDVLTQMPLASLDLDETNINDKQLIKLAKIKTLNNVKVQNCPFITPEGPAGFHRFFKMMWHHDCGLEVAENSIVVGLSEKMRENDKEKETEKEIKAENEP